MPIKNGDLNGNLKILQQVKELFPLCINIFPNAVFEQKAQHSWTGMGLVVDIQ